MHHAAMHCRRQQGRLNMRLPISRTLRKNRNLIICFTLIILIVDVVFLAINYVSLKETLYSSLLQQARRHQDEFKLNLKMAYSSMLQISTMITTSSELGQSLLKEEKKAADSRTEQAETPPDQDGAADTLRKTYQLGSLENKPHLLSDSHSSYSWLRGVSPIWAVDPATKEKVYVGALEVSTSFKEIVQLYSKLFRVDAAVLLGREYVRNKMWTSSTKTYFEKHPQANHYVEVSTSWEMLQKMLPKLFVKDNYQTDRVELFFEDSKYYSVYYFPLLDYQMAGDEDTLAEPVGFLLIWEDVSDQLARSATNFLVNVILAVLAFVFIEAGLIWILNRETRLSVAEQCAAVDELTGLFNRRYLDDVLDNELTRAEKSRDTPLALIICDVDYFKRYNDTYGHKSGDECLQKIADCLRRQARRSSDCVARYGGEEFVIVLPRTDLSAAMDIAETARKAVAALGIPHASSDILPVVTVTLGAACTANLAEYDSLFEAADRNLYLAKNRGRNRVEPERVSIPAKRSGLTARAPHEA
jgi:diguanylate cyclase (GGDEF)-like protein